MRWLMPAGDLTFGSEYFNASGLGYSRYQRDLWGGSLTWETFATAKRDKAKAKGLDLAGKSILVVGCAFGFMVDALRSLGFSAWGCDVSDYAVAQAPAAVASYVGVADVRSETSLRDFKVAKMGLKRTAKVDLIVTEDVLPCLSDAQATSASTACLNQATYVMHRVSAHTINYIDPGTGLLYSGAPFYNSAGRLPDADGNCPMRTLAEWRSLLGSAPWIFHYHDWTEG